METDYNPYKQLCTLPTPIIDAGQLGTPHGVKVKQEEVQSLGKKEWKR